MNKKRKRLQIKLILCNQKGSVLVLIALAMVAILGIAALAVDAGALYLERRELQNAVDAAALAGAKELPMSESLAVDKAKEYALLNGILVDELDNPVVSEDLRDVTVTATKNVPFYLARALNVLSSDNRFNDTDISATATASVGPYAGGQGVLPFGIPENSMVDGLFTLKEGAQGQTPQPGWYYFFFKGGASTLKEWILEGYPDPVRVNEIYETSQGNKTSVLEAALERIDKGETEVIVPIITTDPEDPDVVLGNKEWQIVSFALLELDHVTELNPQGKPTGQSELVAKFKKEDKNVQGDSDKSYVVPEHGLWTAWLSN